MNTGKIPMSRKIPMSMSFRRWPALVGGIIAVVIFGVQCSGRTDESVVRVKKDLTSSLKAISQEKGSALEREKRKGSDMETIGNTLRILSYIEGKEYIKCRDEFLNDRLFPLFLDEYKRGGYEKDGWRSRMVADILVGWSENGSSYKKFLEDVNSIDIDFAQKKSGGPPSIWSQYANIARVDYGKKILPLCWEAVFKLSSVYNSVIFPLFIVALKYIPDSDSLNLMLYYIRKKESKRKFMGSAVKYLTHAMPKEELLERLKEELEEQQKIVDALDYVVDSVEDYDE